MPYVVFFSALGLAAASSCALAQPLVRQSSPADTRVERTPFNPDALRTETFHGEFVTMRDELENFPLNTSLGNGGVSAAPTSFTGPPGFQWPMNTLRGQSSTNFVRLVDLSLNPVGGPNGVVNATRAVEIVTAAAQATGGFFTGANLGFGGDALGAEPILPLLPTVDHNARVSAEYFISTIDQAYTFEAVSSFIGFVTGRLYWGGVCEESLPGDCTDIGLPIGLNTSISSLTALPTDGTLFVPARYCQTVTGTPIPGCVPPPGFAVGDIVSPPIGNWSRFAAETTSDGRLRFLLDLLDGSGETIIVDQTLLTSPLIDKVAANTSFESQDAFLLVDTIEASGPVYGLPKPPPLDCPYLDDIEWLSTGPLINQSTRWLAALSSAATVVNDGVRGQVIQQINNVSADNHYRRELSTLLPPSSATVSNDLIAAVRVRSSGATVRGFALFDGADLAARVFVGREPPDAFYQPDVYAQINPAYDPVDPPNHPDPLADPPVIGADVVDTTYDWPNDTAYRTLELRLSANGVLRVSVDGQRVYAGEGAFTNSTDRFVFESENNAFGEGAVMRLNDLTLTCDAPPCAADFNLDDRIDFADLNIVLSNYGNLFLVPPQYYFGNANGDGAVDFADLNAVLSAFGTTCN